MVCPASWKASRTYNVTDPETEMTDEKAKSLGYTHRGSMYGFQGHINLNDDAWQTFCGDWWISDFLVEILVYVETLKRESMGFPIVIFYEL